jgi:cell division protein FtsA
MKKYVTINISDDSIKFLICKEENKKVEVIDSLIEKVDWIKNGVISDPLVATEQIRKTKEILEQKSNFSIDKVFVVVPNTMAKIKSTIGTTRIIDSKSPITHIEYTGLIENIKQQNNTNKYYSVTLTPNRFFIDDREVYEVIGHTGAKLTVEGTLISLPKKIFFDYLLVIEKAGISIVDVVVEATADVYANIVAQDIDKKVCQVNFGNDRISVVIVEKGIIRHIETINGGLNNIVDRVQTKLLVSEKNASRIAQAFPNLVTVTSKEYIIEEVDKMAVVKEQEVTLINQEVIALLIMKIKEFVQSMTVDVNSYLFYGEVTNLVGFEKFAEVKLNRPVRVNKVKQYGIRNKDMISLIGTIEYIKVLEKNRFIAEENYTSIMKQQRSANFDETDEQDKETKFQFRNLFKRKIKE